MGIRVEVVGCNGVAEAFKKLDRLVWANDELPEGRRLKWYKKRRDFFVTRSQLQHRRDGSIGRAKHPGGNCGFTYLDGCGWETEKYVE